MEQHFFIKLQTDEKIEIADMQLRTNFYLKSCRPLEKLCLDGYAVADQHFFKCCGHAVAEVIPSSCGSTSKLQDCDCRHEKRSAKGHAWPRSQNFNTTKQTDGLPNLDGRQSGHQSSEQVQNKMKPYFPFISALEGASFFSWSPNKIIPERVWSWITGIIITAWHKHTSYHCQRILLSIWCKWQKLSCSQEWAQANHPWTIPCLSYTTNPHSRRF